MSEAGAPSVLLAVATYRRPDDLAELLPLLLEVISGQPDARMLVVDNDPAAGARDAVEAIASASVGYVHEPEPGIAAARNRALDEAGDVDLLVFIDDDERPTPGWLESMVDTWQQSQPAAVAGPVVSELAGSVDAWTAAGRFFQRNRHPSGTVVGLAATNNLLLHLPVVRAAGIRFDADFGLSGGSDTLFTRQLVRSGGRIVWCDEAVLVDRVPAARLTRDWVLSKAFRIGNTHSRVELLLAGGPIRRMVVRLRCYAAGTVRVLAGAGRSAVGLATRNLAHRARGRRMIARGAGMVAGAAGHIYLEYRRPTLPGDR
jgi:succinoglycan biosynthesis protein ExoM